MERVAIFGDFDWTDHSAVRRAIKSLSPDDEVLLDAEPSDVNVAALRECRCCGCVAVVHHLPGNASKHIVEMRARRDRAMLRSATRAIVFGEIGPDRRRQIAEREAAGLSVDWRTS